MMPARGFIRVLAAAAGLMLATGAGSAAAGLDQAREEIRTASRHARLASEADSIDRVHLHLHHVVNCLVGKQGEGFDADAGNPCQGQGNGAMNDLSEHLDLKKLVEQALDLARIGLEIDAVVPAQNVAGEAADILDLATERMPEE